MRPYRRGSSLKGDGGQQRGGDPQYYPPQHHHHHHHQQQQPYYSHGQYEMMPPGATAPQQPQQPHSPGGYYPQAQNDPAPYYRASHPQYNPQETGEMYSNMSQGSYVPYTQRYNTGYPPSQHNPHHRPHHHHPHSHYPHQQHSHPPHRQASYREGYAGGRGRGGQRGGRGGFRQAPAVSGGSEERESYFVVHMNEFAALEEAGRRGSLRESIPLALFGKMNRRAAGRQIKALIVIGKKFLGACMSVPRSSEDIILSKDVATLFLNVSSVRCDDGERLVDIEDGAHVAKHVHTTLRAALTQLTTYDKPQSTLQAAIDIHAPAATLLQDLPKIRAVYDALAAALANDDDVAEEIWIRLLQVPSPLSIDGPDAAPPPRSPSGLPFLPSCGVGLLSSAQGVRLFAEAVTQPKLRAALFRHLEEVPTAQVVSSEPRSVCSPCDLCMSLLSGVLTSNFVFECFGLVEGGPLRCQAEVDVLCHGMARFGLTVVCSTGGSFILTALVRALCPSRFRARKKSISGSKRTRDGTNVEGNDEDRNGGARQETVSGLGGETLSPTPLTLDGVRMPEEPSSWQFFRAMAQAFVMGSVPGDAEKVATLARRVKLLTQHAVACRAVQGFIPFFADAIVRVEVARHRDSTAELPEEEEQFYNDCVEIITEIAAQTGFLANHGYGNYVVQTVISELAERAVPGTPVQQMLQKVFDALMQSIFEVSVQKFASNCVEAAIVACRTIPNGNEVTIQFAQALLSEGPEQMMQVALQQFGNYVVRRLLHRITAIATQAVLGTYEEQQRATELEQEYFNMLSAHFQQLRQTYYGTGVLTWLQCAQERIQSSSAQ